MAARRTKPLLLLWMDVAVALVAQRRVRNGESSAGFSPPRSEVVEIVSLVFVPDVFSVSIIRGPCRT
jgi:hypothetical protein